MGSRNDIREGCFGKRDQKWGPEMTSADTSDGHSQTKKTDKRVSIVCFLCLVHVTCLLAARARSYHEPNKENRQAIHNNSDDSGSKLRDKEQQRLSSK